MTPEESSIFFDLLSGTASDTAVPYMDFLADPRAREWDEGLPITPRSRAEFLAEGLQEHARGCNLPIAECRLCHLCGLAIKRLWPELWLSKWPGATAADETREFTGLEFEVIFAMCSTHAPKTEIAQQLGITEGIVHTIMRNIFDEAGISNRVELYLFAMDALNKELRRRSGAS